MPKNDENKIIVFKYWAICDLHDFYFCDGERGFFANTAHLLGGREIK